MNENNTFYCSFVSVHYIVCECGDTFASEDALKEHLDKDRIIHQLLVEQKDVTVIHEYKCGTCDQIFNTEKECMQHQDLTHVATAIEEEDEEDVMDDYLIDSIKKENIEEVPYNNPPMRVQSIPNRPILIEDISVKEEDDETYIMSETTDIDHNLFTFIPRADYLSRPNKLQSTPLKIKPATVVKERKKRKQHYQYKNIVCEVCGKKYASSAALRYHQRVHTGVRPYACLYCPKRFTMPLFQQIHMRIHTGEKPYMCQQCPKAFTNKAALLRHDRVHTGEKPYKCPKCGKAFSQSNSMKLHVHTVHLKMPAPYKSRRRRGVPIEDSAPPNPPLPLPARNQGVYRTRHEGDDEQMVIIKSEDIEAEVNEVYYCVEVGVEE